MSKELLVLYGHLLFLLHSHLQIPLANFKIETMVYQVKVMSDVLHQSFALSNALHRVAAFILVLIA